MNRNESRRKLLKTITAGSGALVASKSLPESWTRPVVDSVMLPAHAETTDSTGSEGDSTPLKTYYGLDLPISHLTTGLDTESRDFFANIVNTMVGEAHAVDLKDDFTLAGISVAPGVGSAAVMFLSSRASSLFSVTVPLNGDSSVKPTLVDSCRELRGGPVSVRIVGYVKDADTVKVRVQSSGGPGPFAGTEWEVDVPASPISPLSIECEAASDIRLKTNVEGLQSSRGGHKLYKFQYIDDKENTTYVGVMAQDVLHSNPDAVVESESGFYKVRYAQLGLRMVTLDQWEREGPDSVELTH